MAANLHIEALAWLRYTKQMPLVVTEVGRWNADVLGIGPKYSIEVEVKKSISDLRADFRNKRTKHYFYADAGAGKWTREVPNYLYFMVPEVLRDKALVALEGKSPKYGLLWVPTHSFGSETSSLGYTAGKNVQIARRALALHKDVPAGSVVHQSMRRLSSELVGLYQSHEELQARLVSTLEEIRANVRASAAAMAAFTPEPPEKEYEDDQVSADSHPPEQQPDPVPPLVHE